MMTAKFRSNSTREANRMDSTVMMMISILATTPLLLKHLAEKKILTLSAKKVQLQLQPPRPQRYVHLNN